MPTMKASRWLASRATSVTAAPGGAWLGICSQAPLLMLLSSLGILFLLLCQLVTLLLPRVVSPPPLPYTTMLRCWLGSRATAAIGAPGGKLPPRISQPWVRAQKPGRPAYQQVWYAFPF